MINWKKVKQHVVHHGLGRTLVHYAFIVIRRFAPCEISWVFAADGTPTGAGHVEGYVSREVTLAEFEAGTVSLLGNQQDHQDHMAEIRRGGRCFANYMGRDIVGYTLYSGPPARLKKDLEMQFPEGLNYGYASYTDPAHRGKGLALDRSDAKKRADRERGAVRPLIWYVAIDNYPQLKALRIVNGDRIGHMGYMRIWGRWRTYVSPGLSEAGISLTALDATRRDE